MMQPGYKSFNADDKLYRTTFLIFSLWICIFGGLWIFDTLSLYNYPGIDTGQWIMYSRFYIGESVPSYRVPLGVSPLFPFFLGISTLVTGNPLLSVKIIAGISFGFLGFTSYLVVKEIHDDFAGICALYLTTFGQYMFAYMISFGGFPQLFSIIGMNTGFWLIVKSSKEPTRSIYHWGIATSCLFVACAHYPSAPAFFIAILLSLIFTCRFNKITLSRTFELISKCLAAPVLWWLSYTILFFDEEISYISNIAGYYRRGIGELFFFFMDITTSPIVTMFFILAFLSLVIVSYWGFYKKRNRFLLLPLWLIPPIAIMSGLYISRVGTDYPRFIFIFVEPMIWSLAIFFTILVTPTYINAGYFSTLNSSKIFGVARVILLAFLIGIISINSAFTFTIFPNAVTYFSINNEKDLQPVITNISNNLDNKMIVSPFLESMWIEGLTGKPTLFSNQFRYLYRPGEIDRAISAFLLSNGISIAIENGFSFVRFNNSSLNTSSNTIISFYLKGEYSDVFLLQDQSINFLININGKDTILNLDKDFSKCLNPKIYSNKQTVSVTCNYYHSTDTLPIHLIRETLIQEDKSTILISFQASSAIKKFIIYYRDLPFNQLDGAANNTIPINNTYPSSINVYKNEAQIIRTEDDGASLGIDLIIQGGHTTLSDSGFKDKIIYLESETSDFTGSNHSFKIEIKPTDETDWLRDGLRVYELQGIIRKYDIGHLLIETSNKQALNLYDSLDFPIEYSNNDYVLYHVEP